MTIRRQIACRLTARTLIVAALAAVAVFCVSSAGAASANLVQNASLETGSGATPSCWLLGGYGTNSYSWSRTSDAHTGSYAETLSISGYTSGDRKLLTAFSSSCSPTATAGHTYTVTAWYKSNAAAALFAFKRNATASSYSWWAQKAVPASSSWSQVSWTTAAVPSGSANLSFGLGLQRAGTITMDDFTVVDNQATTTTPDTTPPTSSIACNGASCSSGYYTSAVSVALAANDSGGSGISSIRYTTDGTTPTLSNGSTYSGAFSVATTTTVGYRAYDAAGNAEAAHSQQIAVDTSAPTVSLSAPSSASGTVSVSASASDNVAVSHVDLLVDGNTVASDTASPYTFSWNSATVPDGTHVLSARAVDQAGLNAVSTGVSVSVTNAAPAPSSQPAPSDSSTSDTLGSGAVGLPKSDSSCGSQVYQSTWEPVPANTTANNTVPANPATVPWSNVGIPPSFTKWYVKRALVTGNYKGTTDEIIQWAACKWGIDRDLMRAVAVQESDWKMSSLGDYCGTPGEGSYGLFQVKNAMCSGEGAWGGYPYTANDSGLNADFYAAQLRACLDGDFQGWLYGGQTISQILAAKGFDNALWGCVGAWFSGSWYDSGAQSYISDVKGHLANRDWLNEGK